MSKILRSRKGFTLIELLGIIVIILIILSPFRGTFVKNDEAVRALQTQGYSDVRITDKAIFLVVFRGGSLEDAAMFRAQAKNPVGREVTIYVCVGWPFKGATLRTK